MTAELKTCLLSHLEAHGQVTLYDTIEHSKGLGD